MSGARLRELKLTREAVLAKVRRDCEARFKTIFGEEVPRGWVEAWRGEYKRLGKSDATARRVIGDFRRLKPASALLQAKEFLGVTHPRSHWPDDWDGGPARAALLAYFLEHRLYRKDAARRLEDGTVLLPALEHGRIAGTPAVWALARDRRFGRALARLADFPAFLVWGLEEATRDVERTFEMYFTVSDERPTTRWVTPEEASKLPAKVRRTLRHLVLTNTHAQTTFLTNPDLAYLGALIRPGPETIVDVCNVAMPTSKRIDPLRHKIAEVRKTCGFVQTYGPTVRDAERVTEFKARYGASAVPTAAATMDSEDRAAEFQAVLRKKGMQVKLRWPRGWDVP